MTFTPHAALRSLFAAALLVVLIGETRGIADEPAASPEQIRFFETQVRPVLVENCAGCHGASKVKAGLRLDSRASTLAGGDSGPSVVPGEPEQSPLIAAIRYEGPEMPPKGKLPPKQVEALTRWVKMGAPWPKGDDAPEVAAVAGEPASNIRKPGYAVTDADRSHWSFRPLQAPKIPDNNSATPIDAFLNAERGAHHLTANPTATRAELIRRATFDLTGLPPTPDEVKAFVANPAPDAYPKLIDRLLESPHHGEKWGRHWLDLVRFAETNSYERDGAKPNAWRFRDYVIRSLNADKPYDQFIREQLAGDEIPSSGTDGLIATGYYRLGLWDDEPADRDQARFDEYDDIVATTSQVFLGLTVDCARCHDHKLDPIPQKDYYRFLSFFRNVNPYRNGGPTDLVPFFQDDEAKTKFEEAHRRLIAQRNEVQAALSAIEAEFRAGFSEEARSVGRVGRHRRPQISVLPRYLGNLARFRRPEARGGQEACPDGLFDLGKRTRETLPLGSSWDGNPGRPERPVEYTFTLSTPTMDRD